MASRRTGRGNFTLTETIQRPPSFDYAASRDTPKTIKAVATRPQNQDFRNVADGALSIRLPLSAPSSSGADATPSGVKQPRAPGCAETSRLASKRLELCLLSAYAAR
jgi:hypothetical protein